MTTNTTNSARDFWTRHGFTLTNTGGNCTAFQKTVESDGETFLITDGEASAPETTDQPHTVTAIDPYGNEEDSTTYSNAEEARDTLAHAGIIEPTEKQIAAALARQLADVFRPGETVTAIEENAGGLWLTTSEGRTLSVMVFETEGDAHE